MPKYQLSGSGWPVGQYLVPQGTILDSNDWTWHGVALPMPPPINAIPWDQAGYDVMRQSYPANRIVTLDPAINRT